MNSNPEVDAWFDRYQNPQKDLVQSVRAVMLKADRRIGEAVNWQAPTFVYKGNLASFFPKAKAHVSLMFHKGATITGHFPSLDGEGPEARTMRILDAGDLKEKTAELTAIVRAWCDDRDR